MCGGPRTTEFDNYFSFLGTDANGELIMSHQAYGQGHGKVFEKKKNKSDLIGDRDLETFIRGIILKLAS